MSSRRTNTRSKSAQACETCRKAKARCEPKPEGGPCHRCGVLMIDCSFGEAIPLATQDLGQGHQASRLGSIDNAHMLNRRDGPPDEPATAEDLLPPFGADPWPLRAHGTSRWSVQPIFTMQRMVRQLPVVYKPPHPSTTMSSIISTSQVSVLLSLYETHYAPWLNGPIAENTEPAGPITTLVKCTVACRHLQSPYKALYPQLSTLVEYILREEIHAAYPQPDAIQSVLMMGVWPSPFMRDGSRRAAMALTMGMSVCAHHVEDDEAPVDDGLPRKMNENESKMWHGLLNADTISCLGTRRPPVIRRTAKDYNTIVVKLPFSSVAAARDVRLGLVGMICDICLESLEIHCGKNVSDIPAYIIAVRAVTGRMMDMKANCTRLMAPLQHELFHSKVIMILLEFARLLLAWTFMREIRRVLQGTDPNSVALPEGVDTFIATLSKCASTHAQGIIEDMNAAGPLELSSAPDTFFAMLAFSATTLICFASARLSGAELDLQPVIVPEDALEALSKMLIPLGCTAERCGIFVGHLLQAWRVRKAEHGSLDLWAAVPGPLVILHMFSTRPVEPQPNPVESASASTFSLGDPGWQLPTTPDPSSSLDQSWSAESWMATFLSETSHMVHGSTQPPYIQQEQINV